MDRRQFGRSEVAVSPITLGSWPMSGDRYGPIDDNEAVRTIRSALDHGIDSFDTAPGYGSGHAEETLGAALAGRRDEAIITTKCGIGPRPGTNQPGRNSRRDSIMQEIDNSLRRLQTDHVDVYLVHWPDPETPLEETMRAMDDIATAGKTRLVGVSNFTVELLEECRKVRPIDVVQVGYNLFDRRQEQELFPYCQANGIGVMAYGSLAYGLLTGAFTPETTFDPNDWRANGVAFGQPILRGDNFLKNIDLVQRLKREVAEPKGWTVAQLALAWVLHNPVISTALVGARVPAEIEENVGAAALTLSDDDVATVQRIMAEAAGLVNVFRPFSWAMEVWS